MFLPSKKYVSQPEIAGYAEMLTDHGGIRDLIRFNRKVVELRCLDPEGDDTQVWRISTIDKKTGETADVVTCQHVVTANGPLTSPRMPEIPGMDEFQGESFHTARWDQGATLAGKRVGVIGTGASAAQVITSIVDEVEHLTVFQRTPTWCVPRNDEPTPQDIIDKFNAGGFGEELRRVDWKEDAPSTEGAVPFEALHNEEQNAAICAQIAAGIKMVVKDPELAETLTPDYPFFCKRALFIDDYYSTFNKPNVTLVDDCLLYTSPSPRD